MRRKCFDFSCCGLDEVFCDRNSKFRIASWIDSRPKSQKLVTENNLQNSLRQRVLLTIKTHCYALTNCSGRFCDCVNSCIRMYICRNQPFTFGELLWKIFNLCRKSGVAHEVEISWKRVGVSFSWRKWNFREVELFRPTRWKGVLAE